MVLSCERHEDKGKKLTELLKKFSKGELTFWPEPLPGYNILRFLQDGLERSQYAFFFLDDGSQEDSWMGFQQDVALMQHVKDQFIVPVKARSQTPIPWFLQMYHVLELRDLLKGKNIEDVRVEQLEQNDIDMSLMTMLISAIRSKDKNITDCLKEHNWLFRTGDSLGSGSYGEVFVVQHRMDGSRYAVKRLLEKDDGKVASSLPQISESASEDVADAAVAEAKRMCHLLHVNVCRYYNAWQESGIVHIRMELCVTSLAEWIKQRNMLLFKGVVDDDRSKRYNQILQDSWILPDGPNAAALMSSRINARGTNKFLKGLLKGLRYLHDCRRMAHGDLHCKNVLLQIDADNVVTPKIRDFGLNTKHTDIDEVMRTDLESVGKIMVRMYYPIRGGEMGDLLSKLQKSSKMHEKVLHPDFSKMWPDQASWIRRLLSNDEVRPSAAEILDEGKRSESKTFRSEKYEKGLIDGATLQS